MRYFAPLLIGCSAVFLFGGCFYIAEADSPVDSPTVRAFGQQKGWPGDWV